MLLYEEKKPSIYCLGMYKNAFYNLPRTRYLCYM